MNTETSVKVNYVGFTRRTVAKVLDRIIFFLPLFIILHILLDKDGSFQAVEQSETEILGVFVGLIIILVPYTVLEMLMITRFGGTPGKLLCGIYIKNTDTFKNITLTQATTRSISKTVFWITSSLLIDYVSRWFAILPILILIFAIFDKRKQFLHDKIAKTVVIDYKPS